jgi:hypothetical protein
MNEQQMLATVIEQFFPQQEGEIETWVKEYECRTGIYYTAPQKIFDDTFVVDFNSTNLASLIARRIYHIRNILVHNKDGDRVRYRPFSDQEEILAKEVPLILFIAEQLIIKTGKDI